MEPELSTRSDRRPGDPGGLADLEAAIGRELGLAQFHSVLRRTAQALSSDAQFGTCLITCSDEYQGDLRESFQRDVARPLMARDVGPRPRSFELSNIGGRVEPAALMLVDDHFAQPEAEGRELFVVEISAHLGRRMDGGSAEYGFTDRFGQRSTCCGALAAALKSDALLDTLRMPWLEQIQSSFGPRRQAELRASEPAVRAVRQAVAHAVLQAEAALTDLWRDPPGVGRSVLLVATVTINQPGEDGILPVGCHLLESDGDLIRVVEGFSLPAAPAALNVDLSGDLLRVEMGELASACRSASSPAPAGATPGSPAPHLAERLRRVQGLRARIGRLGRDPVTWRIYARPLLRSFFQTLSHIAPEVGVAALRVRTDIEWVQPEELERVASAAPASPEVCRILRDVETRIQQLGHAEAQDLLELLCAEDTPLLGD